MLFADDIVLVDETGKGLSRKLDRLRETLKRKNFRISHTKTEYLICNFDPERHENDSSITIEGVED